MASLGRPGTYAATLADFKIFSLAPVQRAFGNGRRRCTDSQQMEGNGLEMAIGNPSENHQHAAEERRIQSFLERAAPIILESRSLDDQRFDEVVALADSLGISHEQLACELRLLEQRGVIESAPWDRLAVAESPVDQKVDSPDDIHPVGPDEAPAESQTPQRPERSRFAPRRPAPATPSRSSPPPVGRAAAAPAGRELAERREDEFRKTAERLIRHRGRITRGLRRQLKQQATQLGISARRRRRIVASLIDHHGDLAPPVAGDVPVELADRPDSSLPAESFRRWVSQQMGGYAANVLAADDEAGLIGVGVHRYHLADVLATHIVRDVATERNVRLERDLDVASCHSTVGASAQGSSDDVKLKKFFDQVAPILAQHRGINAKSRVMMNAVADQLGLTPAEFEQAVSALQRLPGTADEDDPRQAERRDSYRRYLRRALAQLPGGIITFRTERRLVEAGEHFHGVTPKWIKPTIIEVASEMGAHFISEQQAIEHVTALIDDLMVHTTVLDGATRTRVYAEGDRWGLEPMDVEAILLECVRRVRARLARERKRTRLVLTLVVGGMSGAALLLAWMLVPNTWVTSPRNAVPEDSRSDAGPVRPSRSGPDWWTDDVRIALVAVRVARPDLKPVLQQFGSFLATDRSRAYRQLIAQYGNDLGDEKQQAEMRRLLAALYVCESSNEAADDLAAALLAGTKELGKTLPGTAGDIPAIFWGCRTTLEIFADPELAPARRERLSAQLAATLEYTPDPHLDVAASTRQCQAALIRRLYATMTRLAAEEPDRVAELYWEASAAAAKCLDDETRDRLDVQFMAALLPAIGDEWRDFERVMDRLARSDDPDVVLGLLKIYQGVESPLLRSYLVGAFLERLGIAPGSVTEEEMVQAVRKSLGITANADKRRRWSLLARDAEVALENARQRSDDPEALLDECIKLTHLATLACALAQGDVGWATFDELRAQGPAKLHAEEGPWTGAAGRRIVPRYPVSGKTIVEQYIRTLASTTSVPERIRLLPMIAAQVPTVSDVSPQIGAVLAGYLVRLKTNDSEHRTAMSHAAQLTGWNAVRLALADELEDVTGNDAQLTELFSLAVGAEADLKDEAGRTALRRQLLTTVLSGTRDVPAPEGDVDDTYNAGNDALRTLLLVQAKLLQVPGDTTSGATRVSGVLEPMVRHLADRLRAVETPAVKLSEEESRLLGRIPYELRAANYVAADDLQYSALLAQIWLRLLVIRAVQTEPEKAAAARAILAQYRQTLEHETQIMQQLRDVQAAILGVWLLYQPAGDGDEPVGPDV